MLVTFWKFNKRINSTKQPTDEGKTVLNAVYYKDTTDIRHPSLKVSYIDMRQGFNYAMIGGKYFFVNSVESLANEVWIVNLSIDLLATYKNEILNTRAYITRATDNSKGNVYVNPYIVDDFNISTSYVKKTVLQSKDFDFYDTGEGCYILEVINSLTGTVNSGFNAAYILTADQMRDIASTLFTNESIITQLQKIFNAPIDSVVSCKWLPLDYNIVCQQTGAATSNVWLGSFDTNITAYIVHNSNITVNVDFDLRSYIPDNYTRNAKFLDILLCLPYVGTVSIDTRDIAEGAASADDKKIRLRISVNVKSGKQLIMVVTRGNVNAPYNIYESVISEDRPLSSSASNSAPTLYASAASVPMAGMGGGWLAGSLASVNTAIVESFRTTYSTVGTTGGSAFADYGVIPRCIIVRRATVLEPFAPVLKETIGLPVHKIGTLNNLVSGFVQTLHASVTIDGGYYDEASALNSLLDGGIYIE